MRFTKLTPRYPTPDIPAQIDFYTQTLGFEVKVLWPDADAPQFCAMEKDDIRIGFYLDENAKEQPFRMEMRINTDDVLSLHEQLAAQMDVAWGPEVYSFGSREFAVLDPDGRMLIFTHDPPTCIVE